MTKTRENQYGYQIASYPTHVHCRHQQVCPEVCRPYRQKGHRDRGNDRLGYRVLQLSQEGCKEGEEREEREERGWCPQEAFERIHDFFNGSS